MGVVADGVSMAPHAERAARLAADTAVAVAVRRLTGGELPEFALREALLRAGRAVTALASGPGGAPATTCVVGAVGPEGLFAASVGDSRAYWVPDTGPVVALTRDDSGRHEALTAWLGADAPVGEPEVVGRRVREAGRLVLCTDGLWRHSPRLAAARLPRVREAGTPLDEARALVRYALDAGGQDNVTVVVLPVVS